MIVFTGFIRTEEGDLLTFSFGVPPGVTAVERDAAAFRAMQEQFNDRRRFFEPAVGLIQVN